MTSGLIAVLRSLLSATLTLKPEGKPGASSQLAPGNTAGARGKPHRAAIGDCEEGGDRENSESNRRIPGK